jgi:hypothetical protein
MEKEILSVSLAMAENFGGFVAGTINSEKHFLKITRVEDGVLVEGKGCAKFVPLTNIRGIDYKTAEGTVVGTGKIS